MKCIKVNKHVETISQDDWNPDVTAVGFPDVLTALAYSLQAVQ